MADRNSSDDGGIGRRVSRRNVLATSGAVGLGALAGCNGFLGGDGGNGTENGTGTGSGDGALSIGDFRGSGAFVQGRDAPGGTSIEELPDLEGSLSIYLAGGEGGLYEQLFDLLERHYSNFTTSRDVQDTAQLVNKIRTEHDADAVQGDVFLTVDAGSLGAVADMGAVTQLADDVLSPVADSFKSDQGNWVGFAGRARAIPYNAEQLSESDIPSSVQDFPETAALEGAIGWGPSYSAFQGFITAMRVLRGDEATREWLQAMLDHGATEFRDEWYVSNAVADGTVSAGFANHYYALRVQRDRPDAPIKLAFTENDAGALVNVSGAEIFENSDKQELANNFVRHLLSAEAQEFFATRTFAYPMIPGVEPVGDLPTIDELNPPDMDLTKLSDLGATVDMLRDVGVL